MKTKREKCSWLERRRVLFFEIGLIVALSVVFIAFEWKSSVNLSDLDTSGTTVTIEEDLIIPIPPEQQKAKKQKKKAFELEIVDSKELDEDLPELFFGADMDDTTDYGNYFKGVELTKETDLQPEPLLIPPVMPSFPGGEDAMRKYLRDNIVYPKAARVAGIEGTVHLQFIVEMDGTISNLIIQRSPHDLLQDEAVRVIRNMPAWEPGKQGVRNVRVKMSMPIDFKLH